MCISTAPVLPPLRMTATTNVPLSSEQQRIVGEVETIGLSRIDAIRAVTIGACKTTDAAVDYIFNTSNVTSSSSTAANIDSSSALSSSTSSSSTSTALTP